MEIVLSFATEIANSDVDRDVIKTIAEILTGLNVVGNFHLTGDYARALRKLGRRDLIDALRKHEIGYHCNHHGARPFMPGYMEGKSWKDGVRDWLANELPGARVVESVMGKTPVYYTTEFAAAPQVVRGSFLGGLSVTGYLPIPDRDFGASWFCGSFVPSAARLMGVDAYLNDHFEEKNLAIFEELAKDAREKRSKLVRAIAHAYRFYADYPRVKIAYGDEYQRNDRNYENTPDFETLPPATIRRNLDKFKWLIEQMKASEDAEFLSFSAYRQRFRGNADIWLDKPRLVDAARFYGERLDAYVTTDFSLSPAEAFALFVRALRLWKETGTIPETLCVRDALGPLRPSFASTVAQTVPVAPFVEILRAVDLKLDDEAIVSSDIIAGELTIGPGDFLRLMAKTYLAVAGGEAVPESVETSGVNLPEIADEPFFRETTFIHRDAGGKSMYPEGFTGEDICRARRLQSWTWKPALRK